MCVKDVRIVFYKEIILYSQNHLLHSVEAYNHDMCNLDMLPQIAVVQLLSCLTLLQPCGL